MRRLYWGVLGGSLVFRGCLDVDLRTFVFSMGVGVIWGRVSPQLLVLQPLRHRVSGSRDEGRMV